MERPAHGEPSPRLVLAALVHDTALAVDGVVALDTGPGGLFVTAGGGERVPGVRCLAAPEGGYDVSLRLVCRLVPLPALAERVRAAVVTAATSAGLNAETVTITVADVVDEPA
ncbi:MAG TPA: hypothetical protein VMF07_10100 [Solirubrobacteraceae bacterium]|nr:hypothetical protein [Solirubrobacteraceae bacterium]